MASLIACKQSNDFGYMILGGTVNDINCDLCWYELGKPCGYWFIKVEEKTYKRPDTYYSGSPFDWELQS